VNFIILESRRLQTKDSTLYAIGLYSIVDYNPIIQYLELTMRTGEWQPTGSGNDDNRLIDYINLLNKNN